MKYHYIIKPIEVSYVNYDTGSNWTVNVYESNIRGVHIGTRNTVTLWGAKRAARRIVRIHERSLKNSVGTITTKRGDV